MRLNSSFLSVKLPCYHPQLSDTYTHNGYRTTPQGLKPSIQFCYRPEGRLRGLFCVPLVYHYTHLFLKVNRKMKKNNYSVVTKSITICNHLKRQNTLFVRFRRTPPVPLCGSTFSVVSLYPHGANGWYRGAEGLTDPQTADPHPPPVVLVNENNSHSQNSRPWLFISPK